MWCRGVIPAARVRKLGAWVRGEGFKGAGNPWSRGRGLFVGGDGLEY